MKRAVPVPTLREIPLFAGLSEEGLARVGAKATEVTAAPGQTLALAGDVGSGMFVLLDGVVCVELHGGDIEVAAPDFVGELALLVPGVGRVGRVRARTRSAVSARTPGLRCVARIGAVVRARASARPGGAAGGGADGPLSMVCCPEV